MEKVVLEVQKRSEKGTLIIRKMRRKGLIPAVLYGHKKDTVPVTLSHEAFDPVVRAGTRMVSVKLEGAEEMALIKDIQYDPLGDEVLHVDFYRIAMDELLKLRVDVELWGTAPGVAEGGVLENYIKELQIESLPTAIPDKIRVDVSKLKMNDVIQVKDIPTPPGVKILSDPETFVVAVRPPPEEKPAEEAPGPTEPEVITARKEEPEEGEAEKAEGEEKKEKAPKAEAESKKKE